MSFIKRLLSIMSFIFCFLTALALFGILTDSDFTSDERIFDTIFFFIIGTLSFLFARWLWRTAKVTVHLDPIEITDSVIRDIEPKASSRSPINWIRRTSIISSAVSGIVALYIYFFPYRSDLSRVGEPSGWMDALCFFADLFEDHIGCRAAKTFIDWSTQQALEEQIASLESWIFFLAIIFVVGLVVAFLPNKIASDSVQK